MTIRDVSNFLDFFSVTCHFYLLNQDDQRHHSLLGNMFPGANVLKYSLSLPRYRSFLGLKYGNT
jgi:hypothetical protein